MPIQLRPRLNCHYCGHRSKFGKAQGRKFKCENCLAINFFDENGDIADVPVEEAAPPQRFAQPIIRDPLADEFSAQDSIFCSTCLKNQHLYTHNLSQFLPDPDHPDYERFEAELPAFKKGLEERYPQCCASCEPKVRQQLQQATYNARSDHMRRVLDKSRQRRITSRTGWRSLLVTGAGLGHDVSLIFQIAWHLYGSQVQLAPSLGEPNVGACLRFGIWDTECLEKTEFMVNLSLVLGLLCLWWNPKWQHKLSNNEGRLIGLQQYYLIQFGLLFLRFVVLALLHHITFTKQVCSILHAISAVTFTTLALWSNFRIITIRLAQPIDWHQDPAALLSNGQFVPPPDVQPHGTKPHDHRGFNVDSLASTSAKNYEAWVPPTPPDMGDSMDWTPSQPNFTPVLKEIRYPSTDPSPFYGKLPALNAKGIKTAPGQQSQAKEAIGLPPGFFDKREPALPSSHNQDKAGGVFAEPKFFGLQGQADTGLEQIFDSVFSLKDGTSDPRGVTQTSNTRKATSSPVASIRHHPSVRGGDSPPSSILSGILFFTILVAVIVWLFETTLKPNGSDLGLYITLSSAAVPVVHFLHELITGQNQGQIGRPLVFALEAAALIGLALSRERFGGALRDLWNKVAIGLVALLLPQEFVQMSSANKPPRKPSIMPKAVTDRSSSSNASHQHDSLLEQSRDRPVQSSPGLVSYTNPTIPSSIPNSRPEALRRDSDESTTSKASIATTSTAAPWETPQATRYSDMRYFAPRNHNSNGVASGLRGLNLGDDGFSGRGNSSSSGLFGATSSGANIAGARTRRR